MEVQRSGMARDRSGSRDRHGRNTGLSWLFPVDSQTTTSKKEDKCWKDQIHMKTIVIKLEGGVRGFAEDKDLAREIRVKKVIPALESHQGVVLDFEQVKFSTQSFVHALVGEALQRFREQALEQLEFRHCSPQLKGIVQLVVDYSLGGFQQGSTVEKSERNISNTVTVKTLPEKKAK